MKALWLGLVSIAITAPAVAQESCLPRTAVDAGASIADAPTIKSGDPASVTLKPESQIRFSSPARGADDPKSWGGVVLLDVATAGTWRIGLGSGAWISVAQDGVELRSSAHRHGETCIAKMVDFPLKPGRAVIELSAASQAKLRVEAAPVN